jgi:hypothetical protein
MQVTMQKAGLDVHAQRAQAVAVAAVLLIAPAAYAAPSATFDVFDSRGYCVEDEYGFYDDYDCTDYDDENAPVDLRVMRMGPHPRIVYSDRLQGFNGRVSTDLYKWELDDFTCPHRTVYYRAILRLRDPITDRVVDTRTKKFRRYC